MPYKTKSDLPESVKHVLPSHAQDIYKEAFNSAWDQCLLWTRDIQNMNLTLALRSSRR